MAGLRALAHFIDERIFSHGRNHGARLAGLEGNFLIAGKDDVLAIDSDPGLAWITRKNWALRPMLRTCPRFN